MKICHSKKDVSLAVVCVIKFLTVFQMLFIIFHPIVCAVF